MRLLPIALLLVACAGAVAAPAHAGGYVLKSYSQTYQVAAQGAITVLCPDATTPPDWWWTKCAPMDGHAGAPAHRQLWFGGVGIDLPLDAIPQSVIVTDATGTATPAAVCVDHNMNNLCGPSDREQDPAHPEHAAFFCGRLDDLSAVFPPMPMDPEMPMLTQHYDVWVRNAGNVGWFTDQLGESSYGAPLCSGADLPDNGPLGVGTRGTVTITALVPG